MKKEQKEKMAVYAIAGIIFLTICWFMFVPDSSKEEEKGETFKTELPDGTSKPLADSKREAYDQQRTAGKREAMRDFSSMYDLTSDTTSSRRSSDKVEKEDIFRDAQRANSQVADMQAAMAVDQEYQNLVQEKLLLEKELAKKEIQQREAAIQEQQRLANALMRQAQQAQKATQPEPLIREEDETFSKHAQTTASVANNTVSSLTGQVADLTVERQHGFNTPIGTGYEMGANTIRACIHEQQTLTDGQRVKLRLLEVLRAGSVTLPAGHIIAGVTRLQKDRLEILINSVEYKGNIIPVAMTVYDTDGSSGIYCPGSEELNAMKEATANIGSSLGSSISFASSAGQQIAMDVTRGIITGGSQYLSKKLRVVKVTLKENYQVLLLPKKK